jgi:hypothetical protein
MASFHNRQFRFDHAWAMTAIVLSCAVGFAVSFVMAILSGPPVKTALRPEQASRGSFLLQQAAVTSSSGWWI